MMKYILTIFCTATILVSCKQNGPVYDASGNFEADEVIVSAQQNGQLLAFTIEEGITVTEGANVGQVDVAGVTLQKEQVQASIKALQQKTTDATPQLDLVRKQLAVQQSQLAQQLKEKARIENLVKADAATQKQLDDATALADQLQKQEAATRQQVVVEETKVADKNRSVLSERNPMEKTVAQFDDQIRKGIIINPVTGTVLTRYALRGETVTMGKALYKIANLDTLLLKAYITGTQLPQIKIGQQVQVGIDSGEKATKNYTGVITWISDKSEFTPKTIQTKDERANLVYAIKVRVKNDGYLKIGMYGEVFWNTKSNK